MKKNRTTRLVVLVLFLAIVTAVIISGTFAKYTTSKSGTGTATVAKWNVALTSENATLSETETFTLAETFTNVANEKIAPGTNGGFNLAIDATDTEVSVKYTVTIEEVIAEGEESKMPANMKFYNNGEEFSFAGGSKEFTGTIDVNADDKSVELPITWDWPYYTDEASDIQDTIDGEAAATMKFKVTLVAEQVAPVEVNAGA